MWLTPVVGAPGSLVQLEASENLLMAPPVFKLSKQLLELEEEKRLTGLVVLHLRRGVPMLVEWPQRKAL